MIFPYPSAEGLQVGNMYAFTVADVYGRWRKLLGDDVFEPIGFDAFGIHSENFALKMRVNPMDLIRATFGTSRANSGASGRCTTGATSPRRSIRTTTDGRSGSSSNCIGRDWRRRRWHRSTGAPAAIRSSPTSR